MWKHDKLEDRAKYSGGRLNLADNADLMGPGRSQIVGATDQRSGIVSGGELAREDNSRKQAEKKTVVSARDHVAPLGAFRGDKRFSPNRFPSPPKSESI
jgi:hypothetical protein